MRLPRTAAAIVLALAVASPIAGVAATPEEHFVSPEGADAAPGTAAEPWRTLQHAVDTAEPGDVITVLPGTYDGMRIERSGTPAAWITLRAKGEVIIDAPGPRNRHGSNVELETWDDPGTVAYWVISGFEVRNAPNWGIDVRGSAETHSHHVTLRSNDVHHNGLGSVKTGIFFAFTDDVVLEANTSHHNGEHGIYLSNSGDRFVVRANHLYDNARCGLHVNGDQSMGGDGIVSSGVVTSNLITGNGAEGCAGVNLDGAEDVHIFNNVIAENHATGIAVFRQDGAVCSRRVTIEHNTIVQAEDARWALVIGGPGCRDVTVIGNVLLTRHPWRGVIEMPSPDLPGLVSNHNVVTPRFTVDGGSSVLGLAGWRAATGEDGATIASDAVAALLPGRYRHRPDGPAQDAVPPGAIDADFDGVTRPANGASDAGAFETPLCAGELATIVGTAGADTIIGTAGDDVVAGLAGSDVIRLAEGDDLACGGRGHDRIFGGEGADHLLGGRGDDRLVGHSGADSGSGGSGTDECRSLIAATQCEL